MKNILLPIDNSPLSELSARYAYYFAKAYKMSIHSLHTYLVPILEPTPTSGGVVKAMNDEIVNDQLFKQSDFAKKLHEIARQMDAQNVPINHIIEHEFLLESIMEQVDEGEIDLVISGTRGAKGILGKLFGSKSSKIAEIVDCDVLIVPENAPKPNFKKIGFAFDLFNATPALMEVLLNMAEQFKAELRLIHVRDNGIPVTKEMMNQLKDASWMASRLNRVKLEIIDGRNIPKNLMQYAENNDLDLLVMVHYERDLLEQLFLSSYSKEVAKKTNIPLLITRQKPAEGGWLFS